LKKAAKARAEEDRALHFNSGVLVHEKCRKNYVNKSNIAKWKNKQENHNKKSSKRTRSHDPLEECCILCGFPLFRRTVIEKEIHIVKNQFWNHLGISAFEEKITGLQRFCQE
jgi:hypothetical protein